MQKDHNYLMEKNNGEEETVPPSLDGVVKDIVMRFIQTFFNKSEIIAKLRGDQGEKGDSIPGPRGERGERGPKPVAGVDFQIPKDGKDGYTPQKGVDYTDGSRGERGERGKPGRDGSPDTPKQIRDKLASLRGEERLPASAIKDLPEGGEGGYQTVYSLSQKASLAFIIDGGGSAVTTGVKGDLEVPFNCVLESVTLVADQAGSIVVDIWRDTLENFPPTVADSITGSSKPTITNDSKARDTALTGWSTTFKAGDIIRFKVDSATTLTRCLVSLNFVRN